MRISHRSEHFDFRCLAATLTIYITSMPLSATLFMKIVNRYFERQQFFSVAIFFGDNQG